MSSVKGGFHFPWTFAAAALAIVLALLRAEYVEHVLGAYTSCHGCFALPAFGHDAWLLSALLFLLGFGALAYGHGLSRLARIACALLLLAQAADLGLLHLLNQRLYLADVSRFIGDVGADWSVMRSQLFAVGGIVYLTFALVTLIVIGGLALSQPRPAPIPGGILFAAGLLAAALALVAERMPLRYVHEDFVQNVFEVNLPQGREKAFSPVFARHAEQRSQRMPEACSPGKPTGVNVVLVITESLSAYQSKLLGGAHDWLPHLDALALTNHYFTRFYANGFTTDGGEISMLVGRPPLTPAGAAWYSAKDFGPGPNTVPGIAHRAGYEAAHFTTASLAFLGTGAWLRELEFDHVEGNENPYYANLPKGQFGAAEDAALFGRFEQWLDQRRDPRPFVAVLLTVSSHPPFVNPRTGKIDPEGTFRYVDNQLADFHDALARRRFFDNGILLITGDHHSMTPISREEYAKFGERAFARIPLIVAGAVDMPKVVDAPFQQSDFPASVAHILGVDYCRTPFNGIFLDPQPAPARYVVQARGDNRNRVDIYYGDRVASYREDGDASAWIGAPPPDAPAIAAWIDTQRLRNAAAKAQ
ncbi:MAG: LTA synthase family protein [Rudaea sp.]